MKQCFEIVKNRMAEALAAEGFKPGKASSGGRTMSFELDSEKENILVEYNTGDKLFTLMSRPASGEDGAEADYTKLQTYIFDMESGDGTREAGGIANEFIETLTAPRAKAAAAAQNAAKRRKSNDSDESSAAFFVNRIPSVLPSCREPLVKHKAHYGQLLPRHFCEEVVVPALDELLRKGTKKEAESFFALLENMYTLCDLDAKSIIMQVIMASITDEKNVAYVEGIVSADFKKSWGAAKKYFGKNVRPEKESTLEKMSRYQADTLNRR